MTETKQADEHGTPLERLHWCAAPHITREYRSVTFGEADAKALVHELQSGLIPADWQPTPEAINALPEPLRAYIHRIETSHPSYDNAVRIRQLEEQVEQLQAALGEAERDAGRYRWLRDAKPCQLYITRNADHACNYVSARQWIEEYSPENFADDPAGEIERMKDTDTIWAVHIYPYTPIGSRTWNRSTLDAALDAAIDAMAAGEDAK